LWDVDTGKEIRALRGLEKHSVDVCGFSPDGKLAALECNRHGEVKPFLALFDLTRGRVQHSFDHVTDRWRGAPSFSPDGKYLILDKLDVARDFRKRKEYRVLWDVAEAREVQRFRKGDDRSTPEELNNLYTRWAAFCPGGDRVLVCEHGGRLRLLDLAGWRQCWTAEATPADPAAWLGPAPPGFSPRLPPSWRTPSPLRGKRWWSPPPRAAARPPASTCAGTPSPPARSSESSR
jgi:WD40 repeat protein